MMPAVRRTGYWLAFGAAAAALAVTGWPGAAAGPATWINRVDVIVAPALLAAAGWAARRVFGPPGGSRLARGVRAGGYAAVFVLLLVKAQAERPEYVAWHGSSWLAGLWTGEILFLVAMAAYVAWLTAVTARRPPARPVALAIGTVAGAASGLVLLALPAVGNPLHVPGAALTVLHGMGRGVAIPLALGGAIAAGLKVARRIPDLGIPDLGIPDLGIPDLGIPDRGIPDRGIPDRGIPDRGIPDLGIPDLGIPDRASAQPLPDVRARQGVAAGLCAGAVAALVVSVAGLTAAALAPHAAGIFPLPLPDARHVPPGVVAFEVSLSASAAGYLLPLVVFPVLGAGLGAWGGMAAGRPAPGNGGGGGGPAGPVPPPPPPEDLSEKPVPPFPPPDGPSEEPEEEYVRQLAGVGSGAGSTAVKDAGSSSPAERRISTVRRWK